MDERCRLTAASMVAEGPGGARLGDYVVAVSALARSSTCPGSSTARGLKIAAGETLECLTRQTSGLALNWGRLYNGFRITDELPIYNYSM